MIFEVPEGTTHFMFYYVHGVHWQAYCTVDKLLWGGYGHTPETAWENLLLNRANGKTLTQLTAERNAQYVRPTAISKLNISLDI